MTQLHAVCDRCRGIFTTNNLIEAGEGARFTMTGTKVGPCPNCGGMGSIPDGEYESSGGILRLLRDVQPNQLIELATLIRNRASVDEVASVAQTASPQLADAVQRNRGNWETWAPILLSIIMFLLGPAYAKLFEGEAAPTSPDVQIIRERVADNSGEQAPGSSLRNQQPRNQECACGSGRKYKHCHGKWQPPAGR